MTSDARARALSLIDPGSWREFLDARASPWLARWGIAPRPDDGVIVGSARIDGRPVIVVSQDRDFLGGSVGAGHAVTIECALRVAIAENAAAVVLLLDSGGVRLHEANAAEVALGRALQALFDARRAGVRCLGVVAGGCFGGASILACACERLWMPPGSRLGLSGPKVIESVHGKTELDAEDVARVDAIVGAKARIAQGVARPLDDLGAALRGVLDAALDGEPQGLDLASVDRWWTRLAARVGRADSRTAWLRQLTACTAGAPAAVLRPFGPDPMGPEATLGADRALLDWLALARGRAALVVIEDSPGHEVSGHAESVCLSEILALHAAVLNLARIEDHPVIGVLAGLGHSAAFFANGLQGTVLAVADRGRLEVMRPQAIARVTRLPPEELHGLIESDVVLGRSAECLFELGAASARLGGIDDASLALLIDQLRPA